MLSGTFCRLHCPHCVLHRPLWFGAFGMAPLVAMGRADAAEAHPIGSEEGNHEGLFILRPVARHQACQLGFPPLACSDRDAGHKTSRSLSCGFTAKQSSLYPNVTTRCERLTTTVLQHQMQAKVLLGTVQPEVTCGSQVKGQPAFLCRPQFSLFQQQRLQVAEDDRTTL